MLSSVKNFEIYRLPDGKDYYTVRGGHGIYFLYPLDESAPSPTYEITADGRIMGWWTKANCYTLDQVQDTGRRFRFDVDNNLPPFLTGK